MNQKEQKKKTPTEHLDQLNKTDAEIIEKLKWHNPRRLILYFLLPAPAVIYVILSHTVPTLPAVALFLSGMILGIAIEKSQSERVRKVLLKLAGKT
ncbi:MAG: hypothetical protein ABUK01_15775 [Leptospirales bacterium]